MSCDSTESKQCAICGFLLGTFIGMIIVFMLYVLTH